MTDFHPVFGIDLGTTFSAIAYIDEHNKPVVVMNQENKPITPSVVHFYDKENFVVGDEAVNMLKADPQNTVSFVKRSMGDPDFRSSIYGKDYTPQEISALILKKLVQDAENYLRQQGMDVVVRDVVITVPGYFGLKQRGAAKEAGELAGLNVLNLINAPSAAALAYGINQLGKDQSVFVFHLGGGTFDVTILDIKGNEIKMVASDGDPELGGKDWDDVLLDYCAETFEAKHGADPRDDYQSVQELYERAVKAKISLSKRNKSIIVVCHNRISEYIEITREKFEELTKKLIQQCRSMSESVLQKAGKTWNDIDQVLLVGGSTYMPMVRNLVKEMSGKEPSTDVNPDLCVAMGAAFQARYTFIGEQCKCKACEEHFKRRMQDSTENPEDLDADHKAPEGIMHGEGAQSIRPFLQAEMTRIESFLALARTIDNFRDVRDLYDFFELPSDYLSPAQVKTQVDEAVNRYRLLSASPKYKDLSKRLFREAPFFIEVLQNRRNEYDRYRIESNPDAKILKVLFRFASRHGSINVEDRKWVIDEAVSLPDTF